MRGVLGLATVLALSSCAFAAAYDAEVISGDETSVSVRAGRAANPGPVAQEHCARYGSQAVLAGVQPIGDESVANRSVYVFSCQ